MSRGLEAHFVLWGTILVGLIVVMAIIGYTPPPLQELMQYQFPWQTLRSLAI